MSLEPIRVLPGKNAGDRLLPNCFFQRNEKSRQLAAFLCLKKTRSDSECFHSLVQAALVTRCFVLGHNAFVDHAVDHRYSIFVGYRRSVLVAGIARLFDVLDLGTHKRTHAHIVLSGLLRLAGAFSC